MASSDRTFETENATPVRFSSEAIGNPAASISTLQRRQYILFQRSPSSACPTPCSPAIEMVVVSSGQDEQRSDSGRGASDEEAVFQLCGVPISTDGKVSGSGIISPECAG